MARLVNLNFCRASRAPEGPHRHAHTFYHACAKHQAGQLENEATGSLRHRGVSGYRQRTYNTFLGCAAAVADDLWTASPDVTCSTEAGFLNEWLPCEAQDRELLLFWVFSRDLNKTQLEQDHSCSTTIGIARPKSEERGSVHVLFQWYVC